MSASQVTLLTGATGFIGHVLLAELIRRGHTCAALVSQPDWARPQLARLLAELGVDSEQAIAAGTLHLFAGRLPEHLPESVGLSIRRVVHAAACTRFDPDAGGEPMRTNVDGARSLLDWMAEHDIPELHLVSTAFVCGTTSDPLVPEQLIAPLAFHNAYEHSKYLAEVEATRWAAAAPARICTIHRPSIVVGNFHTGRTTRFSGLYLMFRAADILSRLLGADTERRRDVPLRIACRPHDHVNIIPVDHVVAAMADIIDHPDLQGRTYHHVHPDPPTNAHIRAAIEEAFDIAGGRFVDPGDPELATLNDIERTFDNAIRVIRPYLVDPVTFARDNADAVDARAGRRCPTYDAAALRRLIDYAADARFGRSTTRDARTPAMDAAHPCATYFEHVLPERIARSRIARLAALTTTVCFDIADVPGGTWLCRFEKGALTDVRRGGPAQHADFTYRTRLDGFWDVVTARVSPQQVFLEGRADMSGNVEAALKMGVILEEFNREHPWPGDGSTNHA